MSDTTPTYVQEPIAPEAESPRRGETWQANAVGHNPPYNQANEPGIRMIDPGLIEALFGDEKA